nr:hypothetical protein [Tanacetum cinerariifolium]
PSIHARVLALAACVLSDPYDMPRRAEQRRFEAQQKVAGHAAKLHMDEMVVG